MNAPNINITPEDPEQLGCAIGIDYTPQVILSFTLSPAGNTYLSTQRGAYPYHIGRLL